jgi:hypothetical protein
MSVNNSDPSAGLRLVYASFSRDGWGTEGTVPRNEMEMISRLSASAALPPMPLDTKLGGPQRPFGRCGEDKILFLSTRMEAMSLVVP